MNRKSSALTFLAKTAKAMGGVALIASAAWIPGYSQEKRQSKQYQPSVQPAADTVGPNVIVSPGEDYRIGPSDVIEIQVEDAPELSRRIRVSADGGIAMPYLGRIMAKEKTTQQLADMIADALRGQYLNTPSVTVTVREINSRTYFIQGAVRRPGIYQIEGRTSLLKLITVAGGLNENHGSTVFIIQEVRRPGGPQTSGPPEPTTGETGTGNRETPGDGGDMDNYRLVKVNINGLLRGSFDQNAFVEPSDIVFIPPADIFFVAGEVNAPGSFPLRDGTTIRQAISLAQGMTFKAASGRGTIFREDAKTGTRQEIKVDIGAVMNGKSQDVALQSNDIIIVPNSRAKSVTDTILKAFGVNAWRFPRRGN
jgi:polysaccharide export outer membrane protein